MPDRDPTATDVLSFEDAKAVAGQFSTARDLYKRFDETGELQHLEEAISIYRAVLERVPIRNPARSSILNGLTEALSTRFTQIGQLGDIDEAVLLCRNALDLRPLPHPHRWKSIITLATTLDSRFRKTLQTEDVDEVISLYREALNLFTESHPIRLSVLSCLATSHCDRFRQTKQDSDLEEAITLHRDTLSLNPEPHPERYNFLRGLANVLRVKFTERGQQKDIDEAIELHRKALELLPAIHLDRSMSLGSLAASLHLRFQTTGRLGDLDEAILLHRETLVLRPRPHSDRFTTLHNLASSIYSRFIQTDQPRDINEAISLYKEALDQQPLHHPQGPDLICSLAGAIYTRFGQTDQLEDLDEAIEMHRKGLALRSTDSRKDWASLNGLASALDTRFSQTGHLKDLDEAIQRHREALQLLPKTHPARSRSLYNLANTLDTQFRNSGQLKDINEAIELHREALSLRPTPHPFRCNSLKNLAISLAARSSDPSYLSDINEAVSIFRDAVQCQPAPTSHRFFAAHAWVKCTDGTHESALDAYQAAIGLLPSLATLGLDLQSRQKVLQSDTDGLARDAASCAVRSGKFEMAVELLEEGRGIFWSQALQLRTPLNELQLVAPKLAKELQDISRDLERGSFRSVSGTTLDDSQLAMTVDQEMVYYRDLNDKRLKVLEDIRDLDGFSDFLHPKPFSTLKQVAVNGPVVILNATSSRCDALIVNLTGVMHVHLPVLTARKAETLVSLLRHLTSQNIRQPTLSEQSQRQINSLMQQLQGESPSEASQELADERRGSRPAFSKASGPDGIFQFVLSKLWVFVCEPVVSALNLKKSETPARLWWCPTGPFSFLPIHAAGIYGGSVSDHENLSEYVISSYTPTLSALLAPMPLPVNPFIMSVVISPNSPGHNPLPFALDELAKIMQHVPNKCVRALGVGGANQIATAENVLSHLSAASIVHFACHGSQNMKNPLDSAFLLDGGPLKVSSIMEKHMPNTSLAFLCACQTATGHDILPDEAMHLAATLLFAGFRGVVGTMWSIADIDGPKVAGRFYEQLFQKNASEVADVRQQCPDTTEAARALHISIAKLRDEKCPFIRWVPFIHLGL